MAHRYIDMSLNVFDLNGDGTGDSWINSGSFYRFSQYYNQLNNGQRLCLGADIQNPVVINASEKGFLFDRDGIEGALYYIMAGAKGNYIYTGIEQESIKFIGKLETPNRRADTTYNQFAGIVASYQCFQGFQAHNFTIMFYVNDNKTGIQFVDTKAENVEQVIKVATNCTDLIITNFVAKDCYENAIILGEGATNVLISDFSIHGFGNEKGEARFINIAAGHSDVKIMNGTINGAIDAYVLNELTEQGIYNQGDGISIEEGGDVEILNVVISGSTDRGFDIKAYLEMYDCEVHDSKIGVATWNGGKLERVYIGNPKSNSANASVAFQCVSSVTEYVDCGAVVGGETSGHNKPSKCFMAYQSGAGIIVKGGDYHIGKNALMCTGSSGTYITLISAKVNGVEYSGTKTFTEDTDWNIEDGFD